MKTKPLKLYDLFPFRYYTDSKLSRIDDMLSYIPKIAEMGFNTVWIHPFQATSKLKLDHNYHVNGHKLLSGSLYAMYDLSFNQDIFGPKTSEQSDEDYHASCEEKIKNLVRKIKEYGMKPIFDLVLNHLAIDSPLISSAGPLAAYVDSHVNGRWKDIKGLDYYLDNTTNRGMLVTADIEKVDKIFEIFWTPIITKYICDYGFEGVRMDAITHLPFEVIDKAQNLIIRLVKESYDHDAILFGELMVTKPFDFLSVLEKLSFTHLTHPCSFFWGHCIEGGYSNEITNAPFYQQTLELKPNKIFQGLVAVIGNHDTGSLKAKILLDLAYAKSVKRGKVRVYDRFKSATIKAIRSTSELMSMLKSEFELSDDIEKQIYLELNCRMQEKIFIQAMSCAGGFYILAGDELGVCHKPSVFHEYQDTSSLKSRDHCEHSHLLQPYIQGINHILERIEAVPKDLLNYGYEIIENEVFTEKPASYLFFVHRKSSIRDVFIFTSNDRFEKSLTKIRELIALSLRENDVSVFFIDSKGACIEFIEKRYTSATAATASATAATASATAATASATTATVSATTATVSATAATVSATAATVSATAATASATAVTASATAVPVIKGDQLAQTDSQRLIDNMLGLFSTGVGGVGVGVGVGAGACVGASAGACAGVRTDIKYSYRSK